ncbi:MAG: biotin/lipoyl-containing protein [Planctomycetaceae bacterium]
MAVELKVPAVGESITEVHIGAWHAEKGTYVDADANVVELETDTATFDVPAPINGIVTEILKKVGEQASVGEVIGYMEPAERPAGAAAASGGGSNGSEAKSESAPAASTATETRVMPSAGAACLQRKGYPLEKSKRLVPADVCSKKM